jgi:YHS domain-containing protein
MLPGDWQVSQLIEIAAFYLTRWQALHTLGSTLPSSSFPYRCWPRQTKMMTFFARIVRYLFWILVVSWSVSLLRRLVNSMRAPAANNDVPLDVPNDAVTRKLVRDPICGMHLAEGLAVVQRQGGEVIYFCSEACREKFAGAPKKFVANA